MRRKQERLVGKTAYFPVSSNGAASSRLPELDQRGSASLNAQTAACHPPCLSSALPAHLSSVEGSGVNG